MSTAASNSFPDQPARDSGETTDRTEGSEGSGRLVGLGDRSLYSQQTESKQRLGLTNVGWLTWTLAGLAVLTLFGVTLWILGVLYDPSQKSVPQTGETSSQISRDAVTHSSRSLSWFAGMDRLRVMRAV